jgi:hypothetical protein
MRGILVLAFMALPLVAEVLPQDSIDRWKLADQNRLQASFEMVQTRINKGERSELVAVHRPGDVELITVDGESPSRKQSKDYAKRNEDMGEAPGGFVIEPDFNGLSLESVEGSLRTYSFVPIFLEDGEVSEESDHFVGELVFDEAKQQIARLKFTLVEPFSRMTMKITRMEFDTVYQDFDGKLLPVEFNTDLKLGNFAFKLDVQNFASMSYF